MTALLLLALTAAPIAVSAPDPGLATAVARALAADGRPAQAASTCPGCVELRITGEDGAYQLEARRGEQVQRGEVRAPGKSRFEQARTLSLQALLLADALEAEAAPPAPPPADLPPPPAAPAPARPAARPPPVRRPAPTEPRGGASQPTPGPAPPSAPPPKPPPVEHVEAPPPTPTPPPESAPPLAAPAAPAPSPAPEPIRAPALAPAPTPVRAPTRASSLSLGIAPDHPWLQALWRGPEHPHLALTLGLGSAALTTEPPGWSPLLYVGLRAPLPQSFDAAVRVQLTGDRNVRLGSEILSVHRDAVVLTLTRELPYRFHLGGGLELARVASSELGKEPGPRYHEDHLAPGAQLCLESRWSLGRFALSGGAFASVHPRPLEELLARDDATAWYPRWSAGLLLGADASLF